MKSRCCCFQSGIPDLTGFFFATGRSFLGVWLTGPMQTVSCLVILSGANFLPQRLQETRPSSSWTAWNFKGGCLGFLLGGGLKAVGLVPVLEQRFWWIGSEAVPNSW